jgi:hypothetical protein
MEEWAVTEAAIAENVQWLAARIKHFECPACGHGPLLHDGTRAALVEWATYADGILRREKNAHAAIVGREGEALIKHRPANYVL